MPEFKTGPIGLGRLQLRKLQYRIDSLHPDVGLDFNNAGVIRCSGPEAGTVARFWSQELKGVIPGRNFLSFDESGAGRRFVRVDNLTGIETVLPSYRIRIVISCVRTRLDIHGFPVKQLEDELDCDEGQSLFGWPEICFNKSWMIRSASRKGKSRLVDVVRFADVAVPTSEGLVYMPDGVLCVQPGSELLPRLFFSVPSTST